MRKIVIGIFIMIFSLGILYSQNDTIYVMKAGTVLWKYKVSEIDSIIFYKPSSNSPITATDYDGNVYNTVTIDTLVWFAQNLKVTHFNNGEPIPNITDNYQWTVTAITRCYYNNDSATYSNPYGALYNWYTVTDSRNLCPTGWHVPSINEWNSLINFLGGGEIAQNKLVEVGSEHWTWNNGANNSTGFTAVGNGYRSYVDGVCYGIKENGSYWSSSAKDSGSKWAFQFKGYDAINQIAFSAYLGATVRCVKSK